MTEIAAYNHDLLSSGHTMKQRNNFDFLRLFAAALVVVGHGYALMGQTPPMIFYTPISTFGVIIFFSISGYLIAGSWEREPHALRFFAKRGLRLFPALIVVVLLSAFVLGPVETTYSIKAYFSDPLTYQYLRNIRLNINYFLPGVFASNPWPNAVNGSLWSLPVEFTSYMFVPVVALLAARAQTVAFALLAALLAAVSTYLDIFQATRQFTFYAMDIRSGTTVAAYFAAGAVIWHVRRVVPLNLVAAVVAIGVYIGLVQFTAGNARFPIAIASAFLLPYIIITIGEAQKLRLPDAGKFGDFSYGLYLYAFPVEQAIAQHLHGKSGPLTTITLAFAVSMPLAIASWHLIEKHALALKPRARSMQPITSSPPQSAT